MTSNPDYGRAALYAAEQQLCRMLEQARAGVVIELFSSNIVLPVEQKFQSLQSVGDYLADVHSRTLLRLPRLPAHPPSLRERRGQTKAHYELESNLIALPIDGDWALREVVVLHEYAHFVTWQLYPEVAAHSNEFAQVMLDVVEQELGAQAAWLLGVAFSEAGVLV